MGGFGFLRTFGVVGGPENGFRARGLGTRSTENHDRIHDNNVPFPYIDNDSAVVPSGLGRRVIPTGQSLAVTGVRFN